MTKSVTQVTKSTQEKREKKTYDGTPIPEGYVLAPVWLKRDFVNCVLRRRADTGAFASGHSAAATDSALVSHFPFNHNNVVFRHSLEQRVG